MERITVWLARVGFLSIAACTFGLSFDAITDVARETGAVDPSLAWIVPLAVDGMIVTATAVLWTESLSGRGWHIFPLLAIVGPAALSMWANIAHASGQSLLAEVLAAVPPVGLILSLELVAWQIRRERNIPTRGGIRRPGPASMPADAATGDHALFDMVRRTGATADAAHAAGASKVAPAPSPAVADTRPDTAGPTATRVDRDAVGPLLLDIPLDNANSETWSRIIEAVRRSGAVPTQRELADELDVSRSSIKRAIDRNRDEWERLRESIEQQPQAATVGAGHER